MLVQEIAGQIISEDDAINLKQAWANLQAAFENEVENRNARDAEIQEYIDALQAEQEDYRFLLEYLICFVESKHGPLGGRRALKTQSGQYLVTQSGAFLIAAK
jgi:hypothetical protein